MQSKSFIAIIAIAAVISMISCEWFSPSSKPKETFNIQGKWTIDSIGGPKSSSADMAIVLFMAAKNDSIPPAVVFRPDSTYGILPASNSEGKYYVKGSELFLTEDTVSAPYRLTVINDSIVHLLGKDSLFVALSRQ